MYASRALIIIVTLAQYFKVINILLYTPLLAAELKAVVLESDLGVVLTIAQDGEGKPQNHAKPI